MDKKYIGIIAGVVILVVLFFVLFYNKTPQDTEQATNNNSQTQPTPTPTPTEEGASGTGRLSYTEAVKAYKNRYQFVNCSANPGTMSVKRNLPVMLDNRDEKSHVIRVSGKTITIASLDYQLLYPATEGTFQLTCDGGGSAVLNVEK